MTGTMVIEFFYILSADAIGKARKELRIVADEAARCALAQRFDLIAMDRFVADVTVFRIADSALIQLSGSFSADIVQACVVSREPVATRVGAAISERLGPEDTEELEAVFDIDDDDPPISFSDGSIELGELLAQNLAISIDPYPRAGGAVSDSVDGRHAAAGGTQGNRPFEVLAKLKKNPT